MWIIFVAKHDDLHNLTSLSRDKIKAYIESKYTNPKSLQGSSQDSTWGETTYMQNIVFP